MNKIVSQDVRAISMGALEQMNLDLMQCEGSRRCKAREGEWNSTAFL